MKSAANITVLLLLAYAGLVVAQMWYQFLSREDFIKVSVTLVIILLITPLVTGLARKGQ